jgi:uncharacterized membrane protein
MNVKYPGLKLIASIMSILAWLVGAIGAVSSIFLGMNASTAEGKIYLLMGGFFITAIFTCSLMAFSRLIYLFIDIESELRELSALVKKDRNG